MRRDVPKYITGLARELRKCPTKGEKSLWEQIRKKRVAGCKFLRQYPIGRYIADFYCSEKRLVIEVDGEIHDEDEQMRYDAIR